MCSDGGRGREGWEGVGVWVGRGVGGKRFWSGRGIEGKRFWNGRGIWGGRGNEVRGVLWWEGYLGWEGIYCGRGGREGNWGGWDFGVGEEVARSVGVGDGRLVVGGRSYD